MTSFLAKSCFRLSFILRKAGVHCPVRAVSGETTGSVGDDNGGTQVQSAAAGEERRLTHERVNYNY